MTICTTLLYDSIATTKLSSQNHIVALLLQKWKTNQFESESSRSLNDSFFLLSSIAVLVAFTSLHFRNKKKDYCGQEYPT